MCRPDYAAPEWWSVHPEHPSEAGDILAGPDAAVDLFYVHPTTTSTTGWNQIAPDAVLNRWTDRSAVVRHLAPFRGHCRLFAPRYRQASLRAVREPGLDAEAAWRLAYEDVLAAFRHFLREHHRARPLILLGHSQGALHLATLLAEAADTHGITRSLVAAYVVGIGLSEGLFDTRLRHLVPCDTPTRTGCILSWNTFLESADASAFLRRTRERDERWAGRAPGLPICVNPLLSSNSEAVVPAAVNPGSLVGPAGDLPLLPPVPGLVGAACRDGVLRVGAAPPGFDLEPLPGGNMHMHDIALFHVALARDAARRIEAATSQEATR